MLRLLIKWGLSGAALMFLAYLLPGITLRSFGAALMAAAVIGLLNAVVRPILVLLTFPVTVLTLGLFLFVINALMFWSVSGLVRGFVVPDFWTAFWGALIYSVLTGLVSLALGDKD